jgi:hypothetical protein
MCTNGVSKFSFIITSYKVGYDRNITAFLSSPTPLYEDRVEAAGGAFHTRTVLSAAPVTMQECTAGAGSKWFCFVMQVPERVSRECN